MDNKKEVKKKLRIFSFIFFLSVFVFMATIVQFLRLDKIIVLAQLSKKSKKYYKLSPTPTEIFTPAPAETLTPTVTPSPIMTISTMPTPTQTTPAPTTDSFLYPAQVLSLTNWKLTLPIGTSGNPAEILQSELSHYSNNPWFIAVNGGVRFRAAVNGVATSGSSYPRSELREMKSNGADKASWSSTSGMHTMSIDEAVTSVPQVKKHVVAGQIHDSSDDVIVIRLEYPKLYVNVDGKNKYTLDSNYILGKRFTVKFEVKGGQTKIYYNNGSDPVFTLKKKYSKAYFKAGAYTQSNCRKDAPGLCSDSNFGEVVIYQIFVSHL